MSPLIWITGLLYLFYSAWGAALAGLDLQVVAVLHTVGAYLMLAFLIAHLYLIAMGETLFAQPRAADLRRAQTGRLRPP